MARSPKASTSIDSRVIYRGDNLDQLRNLLKACGDLILAVQKYLRLTPVNQTALAIRNRCPKTKRIA